jgi:hypothetical protein
VFRDPRLTDRLFEALAELAQVRPDADQQVRLHGVPRASWQTSAERVVGPALVTLALDGHRTGGTLLSVDEPGADPADDIGEVPDDEDTWETDDLDTDGADPWSAENDPVSLLSHDQAAAGRLARLVERRMSDLDGWSLPALLALTRVTFLVAAGGGWPDDRWPAVLADMLAHLEPDLGGTPAELEPAGRPRQ